MKSYRPRLELLEDRITLDNYIGNGLSSEIASWQRLNPTTMMFEAALQLPGPNDSIGVRPRQTLTINQDLVVRGLTVAFQAGTALAFAGNRSLTVTSAAVIQNSVNMNGSTLRFLNQAVINNASFNGPPAVQNPAQILFLGNCRATISGNNTFNNTTIHVGFTGLMGAPIGAVPMQATLRVEGTMNLGLSRLNINAQGALQLVTGAIRGTVPVSNFGTVTLQTPDAQDVFICEQPIQLRDNGTYHPVQGSLQDGQGQPNVPMASAEPLTPDCALMEGPDPNYDYTYSADPPDPYWLDFLTALESM